MTDGSQFMIYSPSERRGPGFSGGAQGPREIPVTCSSSIIRGVLAIFCLLAPLAAREPSSFRQNETREIVIGKTLSLPSKIFAQPIRLDVSLPVGYETSRDRYPVVVGFQIASRFPAVSGIAQGLAAAEIAPPLIVVSAGLRDDWFSIYADESELSSGRGRDVLAFLRQELFPFLESRFRIAPYRILLGHSASALFCLHALFEAPDLVQAVMAAGPMFADFDYDRVLAVLERSLASRKAKAQDLFVTQGDQPELTRDLTAFEDWLKKRRPEGLTWEFEPEPKENHGSLAMMTFYDGLRRLFAGWAALPEAVALQGGPAIRAYKKSLAERFGYEIGLARLADYRIRIKWAEERNFDALISLCRFGCEERPEDYYSHFTLAVAFERAERWTEAVSAYESALAKARNLPDEDRASIVSRLEARLAEVRKKATGP
jgi:enterochelin esterase-like enzyme